MFQVVFVFMSLYGGMFHDPADRTLRPKRPVIVLPAPVAEPPAGCGCEVTYPGNGN
jgi:hypothetical protein